jgi:hypothetical protein
MLWYYGILIVTIVNYVDTRMTLLKYASSCMMYRSIRIILKTKYHQISMPYSYQKMWSKWYNVFGKKWYQTITNIYLKDCTFHNKYEYICKCTKGVLIWTLLHYIYTCYTKAHWSSEGAPGRALIHVFNNPSATEGYLSWGYLSKKLEFLTPY